VKIGFIGLGNVGGKLAGSLIRNGHDVTVLDLSRILVEQYVARGARAAATPLEMGRDVDLIITCLPSPAASAAVAEGEDGFLPALAPGKIWLEMSTTDHEEVIRLGALVEATGAMIMDCPVSGGCHRADTGNISIFAGGRREAFERVLPVLKTLGRRILHTGTLGSASELKVVTAYEAIRISSGNSFVHETESQVILNGSRDISFTMDLVIKDVGLFNRLAQDLDVKLELSPLVLTIFKDGAAKYGPREHSPNIIRRLEEPCGVKVLGEGFPAEMVDNEPEEPGYEVVAQR
jgi:3-hydroxyisobutyrate dehydrogenase